MRWMTPTAPLNFRHDWQYPVSSMVRILIGGAKEGGLFRTASLGAAMS